MLSAAAVGHGLIFSRFAKARYSPRFLASFFLHVPIGIQYLLALGDDAPIERSDMGRAGEYMIAFAASMKSRDPGCRIGPRRGSQLR